MSLPSERLQAMQAIQEQLEQGGAQCERVTFLASTLRSLTDPNLTPLRRCYVRPVRSARAIRFYSLPLNGLKFLSRTALPTRQPQGRICQGFTGL
jgi:hypothetical protein